MSETVKSPISRFKEASKDIDRVIKAMLKLNDKEFAIRYNNDAFFNAGVRTLKEMRMRELNWEERSGRSRGEII